MNEAVIEILVEETSMENFLRIVLPKILPQDYVLDTNCFIRPHEGKSDLQKRIPYKMKAYPHFGYPVKVLIVHDQDSNDCKKLKANLQALCSSNSSIPVVIRIACRELENWYWGDMTAIERVYPKIKSSKLMNKEKFRNPDTVFGADELKQMTKDFTKGSASREIPKYMKDLSTNNSPSFQHFVSGLSKLINM